MLGLGLSDAAARAARSMIGTPTPTLDLSMMHGVLDSRVSFTRASSGTYTDSAGVLRTQGYNLLTYSEDFSNAAWPRVRSGITANAGTAPDGNTTADKLTEQTDTLTNHSVAQNISIISGTTYTISVYAKAAERSQVNLRFASGFAAGNVTFDLNAGTMQSFGSVAASSATQLANGWWRCSASYTATSTTTAGAQIFPAVGGTINYDGVAGNGILIWGAQVETGTLSNYSATTTAANSAPRFDYSAAGSPLGLLIEEARTNLLLNSVTLSDWTITAATRTLSAATGLDGTTSASRFVATATGNATPSITATVSAATAYSFSICFKREGSSFTWVRLRFVAGVNTFNVWVNVSTGALGTVTAASSEMTAFAGATPVSLGGGWWRIGATFTTTVTSVTIAVAPATADGSGTMAVADTWLMGYAQLEAGSFATSPILTTTAVATRAADVATINPLGSWFNASAGTLFAEYQRLGTVAATFPRTLSFGDGTANNTIEFVWSTGDQLAIATGGVPQGPVFVSGGGAGTLPSKMAGAYAANDSAGCLNGGTVATDASVTIPAVDRLHIGNRADLTAGRQFSGHVRRVKYFNARLADSTLQSITS